MLKSSSERMLVAAAWLLLAGDACASISMAEREEAQSMVLIVEAAAFIAAVAVVAVVWIVSVRSSRKRKSGQDGR